MSWGNNSKSLRDYPPGFVQYGYKNNQSPENMQIKFFV